MSAAAALELRGQSGAPGQVSRYSAAVQDGEAFVADCRQQARRLQQDLGAADEAKAHAAAVRCAQLPELAARPLDDLRAGRARVTRAHCQHVIALEHGFAGWGALLAASLPLAACVTMHVPRMSAWLNQWFAHYGEAKAALDEGGGYLLPFRNQFFVTTADAVRELGLDPDDPDWARIGHDWVRPRDPEAHLRLCRARLDAMLARGEELS